MKYTTAARVAGAFKRIPGDRVTDGIDQTSFLFNGEGASRRNYIFHYGRGSGPESRRQGMHLGAIRHGDLKLHVTSGEFYNIIRDPGEKATNLTNYIWADVSFLLFNV